MSELLFGSFGTTNTFKGVLMLTPHVLDANQSSRDLSDSLESDDDIDIHRTSTAVYGVFWRHGMKKHTGRQGSASMGRSVYVPYIKSKVKRFNIVRNQQRDHKFNSQDCISDGGAATSTIHPEVINMDISIEDDQIGTGLSSSFSSSSSSLEDKEKQDEPVLPYVAARDGNFALLEDIIFGQENLRFKHLNAKDKDGLTALHWAVKLGRKDMVKSLLNSGAVRYRKTKKDKKTPLHLAAEHGNAEIAILLLDQAGPECHSAGKLLKSKDSLGRTALDVAETCGHKEVANVLKGTTLYRLTYSLSSESP